MGLFTEILASLGKHRDKKLAVPRPAIDAIATQVFSELQPQPDTCDVLPMLDAAQMQAPDRTEEEIRRWTEILAALPQRQRHVLECLKNGYTTQEIAIALGVTNRVACKEIALAMAVIRKHGMT